MSLRHILMAGLAAAIWGFNFVVIYWGLQDFPPLLMSALRFVAAALPAMLLVPRPKISWWLLAAITFFHVMQFNLLFLGMYAGLSAGLASLVIQLQAFFTVALAIIWLHEKPTGRQLAGMTLAFLGILLISLSRGGASTMLGLALTVLGGLSWAVSNIFMKRAAGTDMFALFVWVAAFGAIPMLLVSLVVEGPQIVVHSLQTLSWQGVGAILFMAYGATLTGFGIWGMLLHHYPAVRVAPFSLLVPVFGMASSWLLLGESVTLVRLAAAALILTGLYFVVVRRNGKRISS